MTKKRNNPETIAIHGGDYRSDPATNALSLGISYYNSLKLKKNYLLENWKLLLAFLLPVAYLLSLKSNFNFGDFDADWVFSILVSSYIFTI